ncbi:serine/threonine-protein kinase [Nocardioides sp.]|uniref:serine/threonine-protein kinase n=1 Tax=Nocardioides sp. TaxID=35761 RepID=UPI0039E22CE0
MNLPQPGSTFGQYEIIAELGRGAMGVVYRAVHRSLQREVALKLLSPALADAADYRSRFLREAQVLARLDSPYITRVYDAGEQGGYLYIATELIAGGDLFKRLKATGPMPVPEAVEIARQVAEGLAVAHSQGILHRDVKPSNVLLRPRPAGGSDAVLCDLGIATVLDSEHTGTQGVIGTLQYMAPERHEGRPATAASDIYALGCLLLVSLTGKPPYDGTGFQVALSHITNDIPQVPGTGPLEQHVNAFLRTAMAKDPRNRHPSAVAASAALRAISYDAAPAPAPQHADSLDRTLLVPPPTGSEVGSHENTLRQPPPYAAPLPVAAPVPPPIGPSGPSGEARRGLLAALGAILVLALVGTTVFLLTRHHDTGTAAEAVQAPTTPIAATSELVSPTPVTTPPATNSSGESGVRYVCWGPEETVVDTVDACPDPANAPSMYPEDPRAGMNWVFFKRSERVIAEHAKRFCRPLTPADNQVLEQQCVIPSTDGSVCLRWTQWRTAEDGYTYYSRLGPASKSVDGNAKAPGLHWGPTAAKGECGGSYPYESAKMIEGTVWAAAAFADTPEAAEQALAYFAEYRHIAEWRGRPLSAS